MADLLTQVGSEERSHRVSDWNNRRPQESARKVRVLFRDFFVIPVTSLNHCCCVQTVPMGVNGQGVIW